VIENAKFSARGTPTHPLRGSPLPTRGRETLTGNSVYEAARRFPSPLWGGGTAEGGGWGWPHAPDALRRQAAFTSFPANASAISLRVLSMP
jgi:hypothetical protein